MDEDEVIYLLCLPCLGWARTERHALFCQQETPSFSLYSTLAMNWFYMYKLEQESKSYICASPFPTPNNSPSLHLVLCFPMCLSYDNVCSCYALFLQSYSNNPEERWMGKCPGCNKDRVTSGIILFPLKIVSLSVSNERHSVSFSLKWKPLPVYSCYITHFSSQRVYVHKLC